MKKFSLVLSILILIITSSIVYIRSASNTPHGYLDWRLAILMKLPILSDGVYNKKLSPKENRARLDQKVPMMKSSLNKIKAVKNFTIKGKGGSIPLRLYTPLARKTQYPVILFFHGGGFTIGNLDSHDHICRGLATKSQSVVLAVDYRLAPENPFPAAIEDAWTAAQWTYNNMKQINGNKNQLFVAGDSAGGNISAVTALRARDRGTVKFKGQILIYAAVDPGNFDTPTMEKYSKGYLLTMRDMKIFTNFYLPKKKDQRHKDAAPLRVRNLSRIAPAFIITAEFDPLRWSNERYAKRLKKAGVPVKITQYNHVVHGYMNFLGIVPAAEKTIEDISLFIDNTIKNKTRE